MDYINMTSHPADIRYSHDTGPTPLALDQPSSSSLGLYQPSFVSNISAYNDNSLLYSNAPSTIYPSVSSDYNRPRVSSNVGSLTGMPHSQTRAPSALPHPQMNPSIREQYTSSTPSFKRPAYSHHRQRSPPYNGAPLRGHGMSPTPGSTSSIGTVPTNRTGDLSSHPDPTVPPMDDTEFHGELVGSDGHPVKAQVEGKIDKFFMSADKEWTCYRRNYFSCECSFTLNPPQQPHGGQVFFIPNPKQPNESLPVSHWAMSISAIVDDSGHHNIDLVQHTTKRDKGPTSKPEKVMMIPKSHPGHHHPLTMYGNDNMMGSMRQAYPDGYGSAAQSQGPVYEHTFERIQFKQATQNNGKRRAAQQFYHLLVELYAHVGPHAGDKEGYIKVATRRSARIIVRGRSPGHYQSDRRGSQSSNTAPSNLTSYVTDLNASSLLHAGSAYASHSYDPRSSSVLRHQEIPTEHHITAEEEKAFKSPQTYLYFPDALGTAGSDRVDLMQPRSETDSHMSRSSTSHDYSKMKSDLDYGTVPRQYNNATMSMDRSRCGPFDPKPSSTGYYANILSQSSANYA